MRSLLSQLLLKSELARLPQPFLIREMFQFFNYLCVPLLDLLQELHGCFALKSLELGTALQM